MALPPITKHPSDNRTTVNQVMRDFIDSVKREFSWNRPIGSYNKVQIMYSRLIRGNRFQIRKLRNKDIRYLNVGCGGNAHPSFINLDYKWRPNVQICWNITKKLPLPENSIEGIFTEHCLEHITYSQCLNVLRNFYQILKPKGTVRIIVPDAELYLDLYQREKQGEEVSFPYVSTGDIQSGFTPIMAINRVFRGHNHQYAYDARTLISMLAQVGFGDIRRESFMQGRDRKLLIDSEDRRIESLYIEASKV